MNPVQILFAVLLVIVLLAVLPVWPHAAFGFGYWPAGSVGLVLLIVLLVVLLR